MITLTREQIENEPAGRTMDAWIAEYVMEWRHTSIGWITKDNIANIKTCYWKPSDDIAAFWMVIDKLDRKEWDIQIVSDTEEEGKEWGVSFYHYSEADALEHGSATADTVPLAGCRARLLAKLEAEK